MRAWRLHGILMAIKELGPPSFRALAWAIFQETVWNSCTVYGKTHQGHHGFVHLLPENHLKPTHSTLSKPADEWWLAHGLFFSHFDGGIWWHTRWWEVPWKSYFRTPKLSWTIQFWEKTMWNRYRCFGPAWDLGTYKLSCKCSYKWISYV